MLARVGQTDDLLVSHVPYLLEMFYCQVPPFGLQIFGDEAAMAMFWRGFAAEKNGGYIE
jgi:hypothetical protein